MGTRQDASGDLLQELLAAEGFEVVRRVVPDERDSIAEAIEELAEEARLVLTTGGTGVGPRDVTPEATASVLERMVPGIAEAIRADSIDKTPHALLSRGIAGVRGTTLVVNLPGSTGGCRDGFVILQPALRHALELLAGEGPRIGRREGDGFILLVKFRHVFARRSRMSGVLAVDGVPSAPTLL
jgi:molybdenum cofactor synthesis domain-containing protein